MSKQGKEEMMRIRILVNVNGLPANQPLVVERDHPFYSGLVRQGLALEVKD
jgi:hypothetical protein